MNHSVEEKFKYFANNSFPFVIYYVYTENYQNIIKRIVLYIIDIKDDGPIVFLLGYLSGQFCHPHVINYGLSTPGLFSLTKYTYKAENYYIVASDTLYIYITLVMEERV